MLILRLSIPLVMATFISLNKKVAGQDRKLAMQANLGWVATLVSGESENLKWQWARLNAAAWHLVSSWAFKHCFQVACKVIRFHRQDAEGLQLACKHPDMSISCLE